MASFVRFLGGSVHFYKLTAKEPKLVVLVKTSYNGFYMKTPKFSQCILGTPWKNNLHLLSTGIKFYVNLEIARNFCNGNFCKYKLHSNFQKVPKFYDTPLQILSLTKNSAKLSVPSSFCFPRSQKWDKENRFFPGTFSSREFFAHSK